MIHECEATLTEWQRAAIEEPFNLHFGVTNWGQLAVKFELIHFHETTDVFDVSHKTWRLPFLFFIDVFWGKHDLLTVLFQGFLHLGGKICTSLHALGDLGQEHH